MARDALRGLISMPMILATPESLFRRVHAAGIRMFYLVGGFDPIMQGAFTGEDARAASRALDAVRKTIDLGIEPHTSFLVGNEGDDEGTCLSPASRRPCGPCGRDGAGIEQ